MEKPQETPANTSKRVLWVVLLILALAAAGYGVYAYVSGEGNENANNSNPIVNYNSSTALNINSSVNINVSGNLNLVTNLNANIDTSGWKTYTNSEYDYTMQYPSHWTVEEKRLEEDPYGENRATPFRSVDFYSPDKEFLLNVYVKNSSDSGNSILGGGIGAGELIEKGTIGINSVNVELQELVYNNQVKGAFIPSAGQEAAIGSYKFGAQFANVHDTYGNVDLLHSAEYYEALAILKSLKLN